MNNQYQELFISEANEIIVSFNQNLVTLEKKPKKIALIHEIFRNIHTLKGMSATMGYDDLTKITHETENILDLIRQEKILVDKNIIDILFEMHDIFEAKIKSIAKNDFGIKNYDKQIIKLNDIKNKIHIEVDTQLKNEQVIFEKVAKIKKIELKDPSKFLIIIELKTDCVLREARAVMILKELESLANIEDVSLYYSKFAKGDFQNQFSLVISSDKDAQFIKTKISTILDVKSVEISEFKDEEIVETDNKFRTNELQMIKVPINKLDYLMNLIGELVINKIRLNELKSQIGLKSFEENLKQLDHLTDELQIGIMDLRLMPLDLIFNRFPRMVRDLAKEKAKEIDLIIEGAEIGIDRTMLDELNDVFLHLLRNAVDHGIENSKERIKNGKNEQGLIIISAKRERNYVCIEVNDNGQGIDLERVKKVAIAKNLISLEDQNNLTQDDLLSLITLPGFSTAKEVSETSGRGVGLDSVKEKIENFNGFFKIETNPGQGTKFIIKLPLRMAIIHALLVDLADEVFAIPMVNIIETIKITQKDVKYMENNQVISYHDIVLPLLTLRQKLGFKNINEKSEKISIVVVEISNKKIGIIVDNFLRQQEVVIKNLPDSLKNLKGIAGATILGNGKVAMIIDVATLI
ncbi:MAG: chemotaxis protein CheA [Candidatus Margulisiibacteriota bacterium]|jgi:two-component system chemotaxis sensor kinase CheA